MANPHFQNMILWAGNNEATEAKKDQPMFLPYPSDQTFYGYFNDFMTYTATDWTITSTDGGGDSGEVIQATSSAGGALIITTNDADNDSEELQLKGEAFKLSTELVAAVAVGTIIGFILDNWFGTKPWLILIFFFVGVIAGISNVIKSAKNMQK